jgi:hypothetical protein
MSPALRPDATGMWIGEIVDIVALINVVMCGVISKASMRVVDSAISAIRVISRSIEFIVLKELVISNGKHCPVDVIVPQCDVMGYRFLEPAES